MQSLITALKLNFKLVNPYIIKPQYKILSQTNQQTLGRLVQKNQVNYDSYILRFGLEDDNKCLGLKIGQYVELSYQNQHKNYVPISRMDDPGSVDFLVRDMGEKVGEDSFSRKLVNLKQGDHIKIKGPKTNYVYHGYGHIETKQFNKKFKKIGIIAYQTGITATYSLIESIYNNQDNQTGISLLWLGQKSEDFVFLQELSYLTEQSKLFMNLILTKLEKGFPGYFFETIQQKHFREYLPLPSQDTVLFLAGTTPQVKHLREIALKMGYKYIIC